MRVFGCRTGRRSDSGYGKVYDDKIVSQLHLRGDLRPSPDQELMLAAGVTQLSGGEGFPSPGNPERTVGWRNVYLQGQWKRQLSESDELKLTANYNEETLSDAFAYAPDPSVIVSSSGRGRRLNLELQHQLGISPELRAVWGAGYKYEDAVSPSLYATSEPVSIHEERLFGNLEWRIHPQWLINAGGFWSGHSRKGELFLTAPDGEFSRDAGPYAAGWCNRICTDAKFVRTFERCAFVPEERATRLPTRAIGGTPFWGFHTGRLNQVATSGRKSCYLGSWVTSAIFEISVLPWMCAR